MSEIRGNLSALHPKLREMAMCGVAVLNGAEYEFVHHAPLYKGAGASTSQVEALQLLGDQAFPLEEFNEEEQRVAELIVQMTRTIKVNEKIMEYLRDHLGKTALVELVTVIASYNMVSRILVALDVNPDEK